MKNKYKLKFRVTKLQADTFTPVGIYLRLRDIYPCSLLLECTDFSARTNAYSYLCFKPVMGIDVSDKKVSYYYPDGKEETEVVGNILEQVNGFLGSLEVEGDPEGIPLAHGFYGFTSFDSVFLFDRFDDQVTKKVSSGREVPFLRYDFFKVVMTFNHFNDTLVITEYFNTEFPLSESDKIISLLANHNLTIYPFRLEDEEQSLMDDDDYKSIVREAIRHCAIGDVFQLVVSRRFRQRFSGDEFNVYRALRSVNPSPYLFYFDYIAYKIFGSSPEGQLKIESRRAIINPIAGTIRRSGDSRSDFQSAQALLDNPKENSEHVMLVDLARNDLSRSCSNVKVDIYREVQTFSHLLHLVSTVSGELNHDVMPFTVFSQTFPAGTLSGAPKHMAVKLISQLEKIPRGYYGGAIGFIGLNCSLNHAIMIRSFLSKGGYLNFQAGAGIVINSSEDGELNEVSNKLDALRIAIKEAVSYDK